jgi:hypothetical protein
MNLSGARSAVLLWQNEFCRYFPRHACHEKRAGLNRHLASRPEANFPKHHSINQPRPEEIVMADFLIIIAIVFFWILLQAYILPKLGVST